MNEGAQPKSGGESEIVAASSREPKQQDPAAPFQEADGKLDATLERITDGFFSLDSEDRFTHLNKTGAHAMGLRREEAIGKVIWDLFPDAVDRKFYTECQRAVETQAPVHFEEFYPAPLNAWFECHVYPSAEGLSAYFRDITDRKRAEDELERAREQLELRVQERTCELERVNEALQRRNDLLESIFSSIHFLIAYMDADFNFIRVNRAYAEADGQAPEFFPGKNHFDLFPNEENERIFRNVVETGEPVFVFEKAFDYAAQPAREVTYWDWSLHPVRARGGKVDGLVLSLVNVTERKRAETALRDSEQRFREVLENSQDVLYRRNLRTDVYDYMSPAVTKISGFTPEEIIDLPTEMFMELVHPGDLASVVEHMDEAVATGRKHYLLEYRFKHKDGSYRWLSDKVTVLKDSTGRPLYRVGTVRDVTEQKAAERHTRASNRILKLATEASSRKEYLDGLLASLQEWTGCRCIGIRVVDHDGYTPYESHMGFSEEFWEQENWLSLTKDNCACIRVMTGEHEPQDACCMTPGGSFVVNDSLQLLDILSEEEIERFRGVCINSGFLSIAVVPIHHEGKILGAIHLADERKGMVSRETIAFIEKMTSLMGEAVYKFNIKDSLQQHHDALEKSEHLFRTSIENMIDSFGIFPAIRNESGRIVDFRIEYLNEAACLSNRMSREEQIGKGLVELFPAHLENGLFEEYCTVTETGVPLVRDSLFFKGRYGEETLSRAFEIRATKLGDGFIACWRDITGRKQAEKALEAYALRLESVNRDLQEFASVASHDLQEPLRKIRSFGERLNRKLMGSLDEEARDFLKRMTGAAGRMQELLEGLLKYSRVTTHANPFRPVDLNRVIQDTLSDLELAVKRAGGIIEVGPLPRLEADEPQMRQLFQNLIGNALKYRRKDKQLLVKIHGETEGETCRIFVEDNGIGFEGRYVDLIFKPFQRLHGRSSEYEGTGIGLAISRKIVERHGGQILAESQPGEGSTFIITLPIRQRAAKQESI